MTPPIIAPVLLLNAVLSAGRFGEIDAVFDGAVALNNE
jgi:hypothetical protein